jgi:gamma-glutamylputrescine oxidase
VSSFDAVNAEPIWSPPPPRPRTALPRRADVVVVGGGITGVSMLHWLGLRGVEAVLLERERLAAGASGRNAGFLLMGVAANYALAVRAYGREVAREVWGFTAENHALLAKLLDGRAGYARRGSLTLAASADEAELLGESVELLGQDGLPGRWLSAAEAPPFGGLLNDADGEVDPAQAVGAIADAAPKGAVHEAVAVRAVEPAAERGGDLRVHLDDGAEVAAGLVVLATNAYTSDLAKTVRIAPVRAQMLATAPAAGRDAERPTYSNFGYRYWRRRDDGRFLLGGWRDTAMDEEVGTDAVPNPRVQAHLDGHLREMGVAEPVTHRWAGIMGFSPDELPLVGAVPDMPAVYVCGGYTGHGMGFAVQATRRLAAHILDGEPLPRWLRADR